MGHGSQKTAVLGPQMGDGFPNAVAPSLDAIALYGNAGLWYNGDPHKHPANRDVRKTREEQGMSKRSIVYPYIPNSVPAVRRQMLEEVGAESTDDFFEDVPEKLRLRESMDLPEPLLSEYALKRHVEGILAKNRTAREYVPILFATSPLAQCGQHLPAQYPPCRAT